MPCTPNMTGCKASCAHRDFVLNYRAERYRQEIALVEGNLGYATEIADAKRVMAENGKPMITFRDALLHREKPPVEAREVSNLDYGNQMAEESLLAIAMATPNGVPYLRELGQEEFQSPLAHDIYVAIMDLEDHGKRATPLAVEEYLQMTGRPSHPDWDSRMAQGRLDPEYRDRTMYGLLKWEYTAAPLICAASFQEEIRTHYQAYQTEKIYSWAQSAMRDVIDQGPTPGKISWVHSQVAEQMQKIKPSLFHPTGPRLTPALSQHSPKVSMTNSRLRA